MKSFTFSILAAGICLCMAPFAISQSESQPAGSISGTVFEDLDFNGVRSENEMFAPGIRVNLVDANGRIVGSVFTDVLGAYRFGDLPPGLYSLQFVFPGGIIARTGSFGVGGAAPLNFVVNDIPVIGNRSNYMSFGTGSPRSTSLTNPAVSSVGAPSTPVVPQRAVQIALPGGVTLTVEPDVPAATPATP